MLTDRANTICLYKILEKYSDEEHILTMKEIISYFMDDYSLKIDRRTVYSAIETLMELDYDISSYDENKKGYYLRTRAFEQSEIRLMMDAVYSFHSIPPTQTADLIKKLQAMLSINCRSAYKHLTTVYSARKTENRTVFYNIGLLDEAISKRRKVRFTYMQYQLDKRLHPRRKEKYIVSPYGMVCENQNYYVVCVKEGKKTHSYYRIDLMKDIDIMDLPLDIKPSEIDLDSTKKIVYAFAGKQEEIVLRCKNSVIGGLIDRFGTEPRISKLDDEHFEARLRAVPQGVMYWTMQYLSDVEIISPSSMRQAAIEFLRSNLYGI